MLIPVNASIEALERLLSQKMKKEHHESAQFIQAQSKLVRFHAYDLLDQGVIQSGVFKPNYSNGSVSEAIQEVIRIVNLTKARQGVDIQCHITKQFGAISFD